MKTVTDHIRASLESKIRPAIRTRPDLDSLRADQWSPAFEQFMRNRLVFGAMRYETFDEKRAYNKYDTLGYVESKVRQYRETGNQECLVDAANLLMIEFECPTHPTPHFEAADDGEHVEVREEPPFRSKGDCSASVSGDVPGSVTAGRSVSCGKVGGSVVAGRSVSVSQILNKGKP